jgi:hypothetical protein
MPKRTIPTAEIPDPLHTTVLAFCFHKWSEKPWA